MSSTDSRKGSSDGPLHEASSGDSPSHLENKVTASKDNVSTASTVQSKLIGCGAHLRTMGLELLAFVFTFSLILTYISSTTMIMDKVCLVHLRYPPSVCDHLNNHTSIKTAVVKLATNYQLGHSLIQIIPAAVLSCFLGPWSDHYGRKLPIGLALVGMIIDAVGSTICAHFLETRVEYYFIPAVFTGIFGGSVSIVAVFYSYASDCTTHMVQRTMKYAFIDLAAGLAISLGSMAGGLIYKFLGYTAVFSFSICGFCLSLIIVVFLLKETRGLDNDDAWSVKLQRLFSCKPLVESYQAVIKVRPHKGRKQILLLIFSINFIIITLHSTGDINYLFVHHQFGWSNSTYSNITSIYSGVAIFVLMIVMPLLKRYKFQDSYLGLVGTASLLGKNIGISLAWKEALYHIGSLLGLLGGCAGFAARARISKVVSKEDLGKIFSIVAVSESLLPIVTSVLISQIFRASLETFPGMPYLTLSFFLVLPLGVFSWMMCLPNIRNEDISLTQTTEAA